MKFHLEKTLEKLESTSNDDKENKSNISSFKFERCYNKLENMSNLLYIYERDKRYVYERNKRFYFVFKINRKILEGLFRTYCILYSYNYELEIFVS